MGSYDATFNARNIEPRQAGGKHPVGNKFPFTITTADVNDNKDASSGKHYFVEFTSPAGTIKNNYNLWHGNPQTVDIAAKQLSALCHATGIFDIDFRNGGKALVGAKGMMDVGFQSGQEPTAEKPEGGYVEVKKIYDAAGNEPGKAPANPGTGGWGGGQQQPNQQTAQQPQTTGNVQQVQPQVQQGWGGTANATPNPAASGNAGGWQQGGNPPAEKPPWS